MPEQILLQGKILGTEEFLLAAAAEGRSARSAGEDLLAGRSQWITLLCEVLPRALLAELGLARILLGSSGGGQFLLVLPGDSARGGRRISCRRRRGRLPSSAPGIVKLIWGVTDNLGDWAVIRKRLNEELERKRNAPLADSRARRRSSLSRRVAECRGRCLFRQGTGRQGARSRAGRLVARESRRR